MLSDSQWSRFFALMHMVVHMEKETVLEKNDEIWQRAVDANEEDTLAEFIAMAAREG